METQLWTRRSDAFLRVGGPTEVVEERTSVYRGEGPARNSVVGRRVGHFVLEAFLEARGEEAVYRARPLVGPPGRPPVAVKLLRTRSPSPDQARGFDRERASLESLRHPAIPSILASGTWKNGWSWFATDLVVGRPVIEHARLEGLGLADRIHLMIEMCRAVGHAHGRGVLHTALRRESLVVSAAGEAKVLGFGLPGSSVVADVDALGRILYELLSGARPYLANLRRGRASNATFLPRPRPRPRSSIDHVCLEAIRSRGRDGYGSALDLADDLQRVLDRRRPSAEPGGVAGWLRGWRSGRSGRQARTA